MLVNQLIGKHTLNSVRLYIQKFRYDIALYCSMLHRELIKNKVLEVWFLKIKKKYSDSNRVQFVRVKKYGR